MDMKVVVIGVERETIVVSHSQTLYLPFAGIRVWWTANNYFLCTVSTFGFWVAYQNFQVFYKCLQTKKMLMPFRTLLQCKSTMSDQ